MKTIRLLFAVALPLAAFATVRAANDTTPAPGPIVPLPPFHVDEYSSYLGFAWNAILKDEKISSVKFSRVEANSLASRAGIIIDDQLVAIDGHPVAGMSLTDLQRLFARDWKPGDTLTWNFTVERGALFGRQHVVTLRMKTRPPEAAAGATANATAAK